VGPAGPFRDAARAYLGYGLVYWIGGVYLARHGVGVRGAMVGAGVGWILLGTVLVVGIPYLLVAPRVWFERWVLCRRDLARVLALFMAFRAFKVGQVALRSATASVPLPFGGAIAFQVGAAVFFVVTVVAMAFVARAAWKRP
jgi:hypothetical protein